MNCPVRVEGIYNLETLATLREDGVDHFLFDFRPKSFNFIQIHLLEEIVREKYSPLDNYSLLFTNEPDFVVNKILQDCKGAIEAVDNGSDFSNVTLEFWDVQEVSYYDSFKHPFRVLFDQRHDVKKLMNSPYFKGFVFSLSWINELRDKGSFETVIQNFVRDFYADRNHNKDLILKIENAEELFPSLSEYLNFSTKSFPIDQKLELSYRQVNQALLKQYVSFVHQV